MKEDEIVNARFSLDAVTVSQILSDDYTVRILSGCYKKPSSARELSHEMNIPIAATYRRLQELERLGLVCVKEKRLTMAGKRVRYYYSPVKRIDITFRDGVLTSQLEMTEFPVHIRSDFRLV